MRNEEGGLNKEWRKRLNEIGQQAFEFEEMSRLGFLSKEKIDKLSKKSGVEIENYEKAKEQIAKLSKQLDEINLEIDSIDSIEVAISVTWSYFRVSSLVKGGAFLPWGLLNSKHKGGSQ